MCKTLTIYSQYSYGDEAFIVSNLDGLLALKRSLNDLLERMEDLMAIDKDETIIDTSVQVQAHDGEGYTLNIILNQMPPTDPSWNLHAHYTAEHASTEDFGTDLIWPADLLEQVEQKKKAA